MFDDHEDSGFDLVFAIFFIGPMLVWWFIQLNIALICFVFKTGAVIIQFVYYAGAAIIDSLWTFCKNILGKD